MRICGTPPLLLLMVVMVVVVRTNLCGMHFPSANIQGCPHPLRLASTPFRPLHPPSPPLSSCLFPNLIFFLSLFLSIGAFRWNNKNPSTLLVAGLVPFVGRLLGNRDLKYACDNVNPLSGCDFNMSGATTLSFVINNGESSLYAVT